MKLVRFTLVGSNKKIAINPDHIISVQETRDENDTSIICSKETFIVVGSLIDTLKNLDSIISTWTHDNAGLSYD
jgi:hypothetical protein